MWKFDECNDSKARNRLSLKARVQAIQAYEKSPNYSKVGRMFKCSSKQIRTIVKNKEQIMAMYRSFPKLSDEDSPREKRRLKKIGLLGLVMYEWFLRARRNPSICIISYKLIQNVALEVKKILNVDNFSPNSAWLLHFRQKYNITDTDMRVESLDEGPTELDIESIVADVVVRERKNRKYLKKKKSDGSGSSKKNVSQNDMNEEDDDFEDEDGFFSIQGSDEDPAGKYEFIEPIDVIEIESGDEMDDDDEDDDESNSVIKTIDQALVHLKPLEDFALLKEDYRVIGLISQLEEILKNSKDQ